VVVARSREEAIRKAQPYLEAKYNAYREWGQDKVMPKGDNDFGVVYDELIKDRFLFGSPDEVAEQIIGYNKRLGVTHMVLGPHWVGMPHSQVTDSMQLFAEEVMPKVKQAVG
jgi:alkanesulfonate monooxygenase SsuD/methylene tetrahydromethanopterin reductase-like flavin-dependent oxidoreductase (luciferase family)